MAKDTKQSAGKMRKTIVFSKKNADIFETLTKMQDKNENISEYLCELVRKDLSPNDDSVTKDEFNRLDSKVDGIMELLLDIKNNNLVIKSADEPQEDSVIEEVKTNFEYLTKDDEEKGDLKSSDVDNIGMFG